MTVVTIYCDGPPEQPHDRFMVAQFGLKAIVNYTGDVEDSRSTGHWLPVERWEYKGRTGRQGRVAAILDGDEFSTAVEVSDIQADPGRYSIVATLRCANCKHRERFSFWPEFMLGLDAVAHTKVPELTKVSDILPAIPEALLNRPGDDIELREFAGLVRLFKEHRPAFLVSRAATLQLGKKFVYRFTKDDEKRDNR